MEVEEDDLTALADIPELTDLPKKKEDSADLDHALNEDVGEIINVEKYWKSADLLARQESCAAGIARIDKMVYALRYQKPRIYEELYTKYVNNGYSPERANYMKTALMNAEEHWCKTWSWSNETVCYSTPVPENDDRGTIMPFYPRIIPGGDSGAEKGCESNVPNCELLKCYLCGGYITDPYISCAYECEHVIDAGSQVLFGRSAIGLDLFGLSYDLQSKKKAPAAAAAAKGGSPKKRGTSPAAKRGKNMKKAAEADAPLDVLQMAEAMKTATVKVPHLFKNLFHRNKEPQLDQWISWFFENYKHTGFLIPFYSFAPSHKCCNQVKSNTHFFSLESRSAEFKYNNNTVEELLDGIEFLVKTGDRKHSCKELKREKIQIDLLNKFPELDPQNNTKEIFNAIKIIAPKTEDIDLYYSKSNTSYSSKSIWVKWRTIDIVENFIKPLNIYLKEQVRNIPRKLLPLVLTTNIERQQLKKGAQKKTKRKKRRKQKKNKTIRKKNKSRKSKKRH